MNIDDLLRRMSVREKIGQLNLVNPGGQVLTGSTANEGIEQKLIDGDIGMMFGTASLQSRREIQKLCVQRTRLGIPMLFASDVIHGYRTALPLPLALSCSWDTDILERASHLSATEARADGIDLTFAPMVDVTRDPRWGRVAEGLGESAWLTALLGAAMVRGFQGNSTADRDRMLACVKHFAGYGGVDGGREYASVQMGPRELHASHLPPFHAAIQAGVSALMPGFHCVDRIPVTAHKELLVDILRRRWDFDGVVISDYTAIAELVAHGAANPSDATLSAFHANVDVDMVSECFLHHLESLIEARQIKIEQIDRACRRVLDLKRRAGLFDDPLQYLDESRAEKHIGHKDHRREATEMVTRSCVLLKNNDGILPLVQNTKTSSKLATVERPSQTNPPTLRVAVIGPLADDQLNLPGTWSVSAVAEECVSLVSGLRERIDAHQMPLEIVTAKGSVIEEDPSLVERLNVFGTTVLPADSSAEAMLDEAISVAKDADVIVMAIGEAKEHSGECSSRTNLRIPTPQIKLVRELASLGKPIVATVFSGRPLNLTSLMPICDSVLMVWYGGTMAGPGIADLLLGLAQPSGRLTMSMPRSVGQIPVHHDDLPTGRPLPNDAQFEKFKTCYLDELNTPLFPFGFGLNYGEFHYDAPAASVDAARVQIVVNISNRGSHAATEVVQCYASPPPGLASTPSQMLVAFRRVHVPAGEAASVQLTVEKDSVYLPEGSSIGQTEMIFRPGLYRFGVGPHAEDLQTTEVQWRPDGN